MICMYYSLDRWKYVNWQFDVIDRSFDVFDRRFDAINLLGFVLLAFLSEKSFEKIKPK